MPLDFGRVHFPKGDSDICVMSISPESCDIEAQTITRCIWYLALDFGHVYNLSCQVMSGQSRLSNVHIRKGDSDIWDLRRHLWCRWPYLSHVITRLDHNNIYFAYSHKHSYLLRG